MNMRLCTLRQGIVLIAVIDTLLSGILLFLLLLGSSHAQDMSEMLEADMLDTGRREDGWSGRINESRMQHGQHLATATIVTMYAVISIVTVHLISCISLLCGAILRVHQLLVPWASVVLVELFLGVVLLMAAAFTGACSIIVFSLSAVALQFYMTMWGVVWTYYRKLCRETCEEYESDHAHKMADVKAEYIKFPCNKPQNV